VPGFDLTQPPRVGHVHASVLGAQFVESEIAEASFSAQLLDRQVGPGLPIKVDDLGVGEICFFSCPSFSK